MAPSAKKSAAPKPAGGTRATPAGRYRYHAPKGTTRRPVWIIPVILGALVVVLLVYMSRRNAGSQSATPAVTAAVVQALTGLPASLFDTAGAPPANTSGVWPTVIPAADRISGAPQFLYMGAEYCPFCAAERWVIASTLSRFGTLKGLQLITSTPNDIYPDTPTLTFLDATYQSSTLQAQTVEMENEQDQPLQTPTALQNQLITKFDAPPYIPSTEPTGSIPFILIGGEYLWTGSQYDPGLLAGMDWSKVTAAITGGTTLGQTILARANVLTAAICAVNGAQPASVCGSPGVAAAAQLLPKGTANG